MFGRGMGIIPLTFIPLTFLSLLFHAEKIVQDAEHLGELLPSVGKLLAAVRVEGSWCCLPMVHLNNRQSSSKQRNLRRFDFAPGLGEVKRPGAVNLGPLP